MQPYYQKNDITIYHGDLREVLPVGLQVDHIVTDPPYGLNFMEKGWDQAVPGPEYWEAIHKVCKPGALMLAFGGTRTHHRLTCAIEDAGWEIRDCLMWLYGQGCPKVRDIGKMINDSRWMGYSTALKPAVEPVVLAQKSMAHFQPYQASLYQRLTFLENQLWQLWHVRTAVNASKANLNDDSVLEVAALPTNLRAVLFDQMDMSLFVSVINLSLNIVRSWQTILADTFDVVSMSTTKTTTRPTTDWKTLSCCASAIIPGDIIQAAICAHGSRCDVSPAVHYFNAVAMNIYATRELSVLAGVMWPQHVFCRDEDELGLRPDWRPLVLAMKPMDGNIAYNALMWGVAGMNIDASRIPTNAADIEAFKRLKGFNNTRSLGGTTAYHGGEVIDRSTYDGSKGRWPANLLLDEEAAAQLDAQTGTLTSGTNCVRTKPGDGYHGGQGKAGDVQITYGDSGGASRFFYCAKASKSERGEGNDHPCVKPLALMKYLLTLLSTPTGGLILDPFAGSGTTALAALALGRPCVCVELEEPYCEIIARRLEAA